jgi:hypothetical protein
LRLNYKEYRALYSPLDVRHWQHRSEIASAARTRRER